MPHTPLIFNRRTEALFHRIKKVAISS